MDDRGFSDRAAGRETTPWESSARCARRSAGTARIGRPVHPVIHPSEVNSRGHWREIPCDHGAERLRPQFPLKDELAGKLVKCPECGERTPVPGGDTALPEGNSPVSIALLAKEVPPPPEALAISGKVLRVGRGGPDDPIRNRGRSSSSAAASHIVGLAVLIALVGGAIALGTIVSKTIGPRHHGPGVSSPWSPRFSVIIMLAPSGHVFSIGRHGKGAPPEGRPGSEVRPIVATYTSDPAGTVWPSFERLLYNIIRKRW